MKIENFNSAPPEAVVKAVFPGVFCLKQKFPNILGDTCFITTNDFRCNLGSGRTPVEAWDDAYGNHHAEIWDRIRCGSFTKQVTLDSERIWTPNPTPRTYPSDPRLRGKWKIQASWYQGPWKDFACLHCERAKAESDASYHNANHARAAASEGRLPHIRFRAVPSEQAPEASW